MVNAAAKQQSRIQAAVANDKMTATVALKPNCSGATVSKSEVLEAVAGLSISVDSEMESKIDEFVALVTDRKTCNHEGFIIAQGTPPTRGRDETLEWNESLLEAAESWREDGDYFPPEAVIPLKKGSVIGRLLPPSKPVDGVDVFGQTVTARGAQRSMELDESIDRLDSDPQQLVAARDGKLERQDGVLRIMPCEHIEGDVDVERQEVRSPNEVHITGRITDRTQVASGKSIAVDQSIEAAEVKAGGNVSVCRGIVGRHGGSVFAKGSVRTKYANMANITARGDVRVVTQLKDSQVFANGSLLAESASVIGGAVYATAGVQAGTVGSAAGVPTRIAVGVDATKIRKLAFLESALRRARALIESIRAKLTEHSESTSASADKPAPQSKLLQQRVDDAEKMIADREKKRNGLLSGLFVADSACVRVADMIYAPTTVHIGDRETRITAEMKGPVSIEKRVIDRHTQIVAVNEKTGSVKPLTFDKSTAEGLASQAGAAIGSNNQSN